MAKIDKDYGKGAIMRLGDKRDRENGGYFNRRYRFGCCSRYRRTAPRRVIEIYGPESSGKTTVALHAVANVQKAGGIAAFIDAEHALDPVYAAKLGVDTDALLVSQPDTGDRHSKLWICWLVPVL